MFHGITSILEVLGQLLPPWALGVVLAVLALAIAPSWLHRIRAKQIKGLMRRAAGTTDQEQRSLLIEQAFALAGERPRRLVAVADTALQAGHRSACKRAVAALAATGRFPKDVARLRGKLEAEAPGPKHPLETAAAVENLLEQGMVTVARTRLAEALQRFPDDEDLLALQARADAPAAEPSPEVREAAAEPPSEAQAH